jgi:hypothetical protein
MAALITVLALTGGLGFGLIKEGGPWKLWRWRPVHWELALLGLALFAVMQIVPVSETWAVILDLEASAALIAFLLLNIRVGGMVVILTGLCLNAVVVLVNLGMPTSRSALKSAGILKEAPDGTLYGARHIAGGGDALRFLGEVIVLPTHQVVSVGDLLVWIGLALTSAALVRGRRLRPTNQKGYRERIAPLGRGPARRKGPGLHPSRLGQLSGPPSSAPSYVRSLTPVSQAV